MKINNNWNITNTIIKQETEVVTINEEKNNINPENTTTNNETINTTEKTNNEVNIQWS